MGLIAVVSLGEYGGKLVTNTDEVTGEWSHIAIIEESAFAQLEGGNHAVTGALADAVFPKNFILSGHFTKLRLSYGCVYAYNARG